MEFAVDAIVAMASIVSIAAMATIVRLLNCSMVRLFDCSIIQLFNGLVWRGFSLRRCVVA